MPESALFEAEIQKLGAMQISKLLKVVELSGKWAVYACMRNLPCQLKFAVSRELVE